MLGTPEGGMSGKSWGRHEEGLEFRARKEPVVYSQAGDKDLLGPPPTQGNPSSKVPARGEKGLKSS